MLSGITVFLVNFYLVLMCRGGEKGYHTYTCEIVPILGYAVIFAFLYFEYSAFGFPDALFHLLKRSDPHSKSILQETIHRSKFEMWKLAVRTTVISRCKYSFFGN